MRKNQSHLGVSGPVLLRSMPKSSGFLLVFLLLTSVCVGLCNVSLSNEFKQLFLQ